jgi:hypothetical protein
MKRHLPADLSALPPTLRAMVERLNNSLEKGRYDLSHLMSQSVPGKELSLFFIALGPSQDDCTVGLLGIINGLLGDAGLGNYRIFREVDEKTDVINYFGVIEGWEHEQDPA